MKILNVSYRNGSGGAGIATRRLNSALNNDRVKSLNLVLEADHIDSTVMIMATGLKSEFNRAKVFISNLVLKLQKTSNPVKHSLNVFGNKSVLKNINKIDSDLVHLHWINNEMLTMKQVAAINKPICWTLHDSWVFCGAEHHPNLPLDKRYIDGYLRCSGSDSGIDINRFIYKSKLTALKELKINFIVPSLFMKNMLIGSSMYNSACHSVAVIPHGIDLNVFKPLERSLALNLLNLEADKTYILFGAVNALGDKNKGGDILEQSLNLLSCELCDNNIELLIFGSSSNETGVFGGFTANYLGNINDERLMPILYSAADLTIVPSLIESFGLVAAESIACNTPVVSFASSAVSELVITNKTGVISNKVTPEELKNSIIKALGCLEEFTCREFAIENLSIEKSATKHIHLYESLIYEREIEDAEVKKS